MKQEKPAFMLHDGVFLTRRGAEMCYLALVAAERKFSGRNGGASPSDEVSWLREVLRLAATNPVRLEAERYGQRVTIPTGSAKGSAVASQGSAGTRSLRLVGELGRLGTREAAEVIGVSERAVRKACGSGALRASRVSGHWLIDEADVAAYRARRESRSRDRQAQQTAAAG